MSPKRLRLVLIYAFLSIVTFSLYFVPASAQPVLQEIPDGFILVGSEDGEFSVVISEDWTFASMPANDAYASTLLIAENDALIDEIWNYQLGLPTSGTASGSFGIITRLAPAFWQTFARNADQAAVAMVDFVRQNAPVNNEGVIELGADGYAVTVLETSEAQLDAYGYIGVFAHEGELYVLQLMSSPPERFDDDSTVVETIGESISVPAAPGALTDPEARPMPAATEEPVETEEVVEIDETPAPPSQVNAAADVLSIVLPDLWFYRDRTPDDRLFIYGNTEEAVNARLYSFRSDLFEAPVGMTGNGGVVALYDAAAVGVSATDPDVSGLMTQLLGSLGQQGYEVVEEPLPVTIGGNEGRIAVIRGSEYGFLALIPFGEHVAYVTGTSADAAFEVDRDTLRAIVESVRVPASTPEPTATPVTGLGGLGDLGGDDVTETADEPEPTATPQAGLGGLGGLTDNSAEEDEVTDEAEAGD